MNSLTLTREILEIFDEAQVKAPREVLPRAGWHWDAEQSKVGQNQTFKLKAKTLAEYKRRLLAGERPALKRPCDRARAKLWFQAAAAIGVLL